ncbi:uncharacterized protein C3orf38 homolog [Genypterus blacodes]|uniref:uncharacterized protein C3orf38 homolog n=1 Tax=Genypterus blacodes TaxID=154954 RepID=UPI003F76D89D
MSGLSQTERDGCKKILKMMSKSDIFSLADTVTNKMIVVENTREAIGAILSYSKDAEELLKRKKVQRELIFRYLASERVVVSPNIEKHQLVQRTLELWAPARVHIESSQVTVSQSCGGGDGASRGEASTKLEAGFDPLALGQQFCRWFFQLLNSHNPTLAVEPQDWGPQHFWPDAKLRLVSCATGQQTEEFLGAELVSLRLLALTKEERLLLSPNLDPRGLRALASPHGPVLVGVAGTIHRDDACLGIYEAIFGLIRSPVDNTWKIKFVNLKIKRPDALGGSEVTAPNLTYDSSELQLLCR